jgi:hypothetical protein
MIYGGGAWIRCGDEVTASGFLYLGSGGNNLPGNHGGHGWA